MGRITELKASLAELEGEQTDRAVVISLEYRRNSGGQRSLGSLTVSELLTLLEGGPILNWGELPDWDDLTDLDKGAALLFLHKVDMEDEGYAIENYPCRYFEHPELTALSGVQACEHALRLIAVDLASEEYQRLYDAALKAHTERDHRGK